MLVSAIEKKAEIRRQTASAISRADIGMSSKRVLGGCDEAGAAD